MHKNRESLDKQQEAQMGYDRLCAGLNDAAKQIHEDNKRKGFWDKERNVGEMLMLVTSELGGAMEAHRKGLFVRWEDWENGYSKQENIEQKKAGFELHVKDKFEDEIADAVIRLLDMSAGLGIDLERHINAKVEYNKLRERLHGKIY